MSSNYGWDANGWEREPFPARDEFAEPRTVLGAPRSKAADERLQETLARIDGSVVGCEPCLSGMGTTAPGPPHVPHTEGHRPHCSCEFCW